MKRILLLAMVALLAGLVFASVVLAQDTTMVEGGGTTVVPGGGVGAPAPDTLAPSGGPAILLPAAALLLGAGILTYAVLRRRT